MAVKNTVVVKTVEKDVIEELSKVYRVNGAFYATRAEAELSLLKGELYASYLDRAKYSSGDKTRMLASAEKSGYVGVYVYIDDVITILADRGVSFTSEPPEDAVVTVSVVDKTPA